MTLPSSVEVLSFYLYGATAVPTRLIDGTIIRSSEAPQNYPALISTSDFMDPITGPGRFAKPSQFKVVQEFFHQSGGLSDLAPGVYTYERIIALAGITSSERLVEQQGLFWDDGSGDYAYRSFIWGTTAYEIVTSSGHSPLFVVGQDHSRSIQNLLVSPFNKSANTPDENFDFTSDSGAK